MNRVVLDAELRAKLNGGQTGAEIVDEAGNVVGHYLTHEAFARLVQAIQPPPLTREEIAEARREMLANGGMTTEEVLAALEQARRNWEALR